MRDDPTGAAGFDRTFRISYPSLADPGSQVALAFRTTVPPGAIPSTLIIDRTGHIAVRVLGSVSYDSLKSLVAQVSGPGSLAAGGGGS
jgi:peroxiredoxin